ncbi:PREDICTED: interferon alpha-2-like [Ceratotherium simum simum]|uniref:Interferon alpha-2-like n=1 Tax=Ceratotherium simum simum TaxID=73337 RepID=A0ABM1D7T5_CERSS|nr:PREDICTED: interferon alpha-2-like [Ceratotherium simum simum]
MAQIHWLVAGVMLCSISACSLGGDLRWTGSLRKTEILMLLKQLENIPSQSCLNDRNDFKFPGETDNITQIERTQVTCFHQEMLQQVFNLFSTEHSRAAWNTTILDQLLSRLDHSLERVEEENLACPYLGIVVRKYFQGIHCYLKEKNFSPCAWEIVRVEMQRCLSLM